MPITRFAPSPTGLLHLGHAHAALFAASAVGESRMQLRIEDIDLPRCDAKFTAAILEDLAWLGLDWQRPERIQSQHFDDYAASFERLHAAGLVYPCFCSRADLLAAAVAPHGRTPIYPGTCRRLWAAEREERMARGLPHAWRLDCAEAMRRAGPLDWLDRALGSIRAKPELLGDVVLMRKDIAASYHLAVTCDDAIQGVELVTRGEDLFESTHIHRLLQALLELPVPEWQHHRLLRDEHGRRLSKRDGAPTLRALREAGHSPASVRAQAGFGD